MLQAGVFDDFKSATTLLLWGDREGMASLLEGLSALRDGRRTELAVSGPGGELTVHVTSDPGDGSTLAMEGEGFRWACSRQTVGAAANLIEPLLHGAGHQYLDVSGLAEQVIIARDEYPADLR